MAVSLKKGQKVSLKKKSGDALSKVTLGLGWDPLERKGLFGSLFGKKGVDLDASCVLFDAQGERLEVVSFRQLQNRNHSVVHTGDNLTGDGDGDDEQIKVDLPGLPPESAALIFVVNSFSGESFDQIANAYVRLIDDTSGQEQARYTLSCQGAHTALIMCRLTKVEGAWSMQALGENANGRTIEDLMPNLEPFARP